jgi:nitrogen fixation/metabolism regulation signal transduction histidine kinase
MTSRSDDRADKKADEAARLVAEMRARVEDAVCQLEALTAELHERRQVVDTLETVVDVVLEVTGSAVVVTDGEGHITGLSRAAALAYEGAAVGKPVSALPREIADLLAQGSAPTGDEAEPAAGDPAVRMHPLPGGGSLLVLPDP